MEALILDIGDNEMANATRTRLVVGTQPNNQLADKRS